MSSSRITRITPDISAPRPDWRMPEPRDVAVLGHRIRYWEKGDGRPLVLMHGFSGNAPFEWGRVIDALARRFRVIALQGLGFAPSEAPDIDYTTDVQLAHLGGFFDALGLTNIALAGESYGGWLVASYAVRAAALGLPPIERLIVVGGPIEAPRVARPEPSGFVHQAVVLEVAAMFAREGQTDHTPIRGRILADSGLAKGELDLGAAATIAVPTLLMWGEADALIPLSVGEAAVRAIPDARLLVFETIGHIPSVECPNEFVTALVEFCEA
jgi:pimeloyl-ACP methyl ester carboxylesterase